MAAFASSDPVIVAERAMLRYPTGKVAVAGVSFTIRRGEFVYLIGPSGAGKSTLLRMMHGQLRPSSGRMTTLGVEMRTAGALARRRMRRETGFVFQDQKLLWRRTVFENVAVPLRVRGWRLHRIRPRVEKVLSFVGLQDRLWSYPEALSGGEQQRVAIARAIAAQPKIVFADEPTGNLDLATARRVLELFWRVRELGTTVIMATHDVHLIAEYPARTLVLEEGRLVEDRA